MYVDDCDRLDDDNTHGCEVVCDEVDASDDKNYDSDDNVGDDAVENGNGDDDGIDGDDDGGDDVVS